MIQLSKTLQIALVLMCFASAGTSFAKYDVEVIRISKELRGRIYSERNHSDPEEVGLKRVVVVDQAGAVVANLDEPREKNHPVWFEYEDFNFDGIRDLAIVTSRVCYGGGESYFVFLADTHIKNRFHPSPEFSDVMESCGYIQFNRRSRQFETFKKSGPSLLAQTYRIVDGKPELLKDQDVYRGVGFVYSYPVVSGNRIKKRRLVFRDDFLVPFSFKLSGKNKIVNVFNFYGDLYYAMTSGEGVVEFLQGVTTSYQDDVFNEVDGVKMLDFSNKSASYRVYHDIHNNKVGVEVTKDGKRYDIVGDPDSIQGKLECQDCPERLAPRPETSPGHGPN